MQRFIFIKINGKNGSVVVHDRGFRFLDTFLIGLLAVEIDVVVRGEIMIAPAHPGILLDTAGVENRQYKNGNKAHQGYPEWHNGPVRCVALQLETKIGKTPPKAYKI